MTTTLRLPRGLYGITPEWHDTDKLLEAISAAAAGGMAALQWRRKTIADQDRVAQARKVVEHCRVLGIPCIINDDWRLAALVDASGAHIGRDDGQYAEARMALGADRIIGCSCYNQPSLASQALKAGADYVAFGAMYPSTIKPDAVKATLEDIEQGRMLAEAHRTLAGQPSSQEQTPVPGQRNIAGNIVSSSESGQQWKRPTVVAIGGITADNALPLLHAGADAVAVISGLFESNDIKATAERFSSLFA
ncbi:thiamine phosphate synthase [Allopusillimonas ginsengisoli]|uniref:thiamine phosphate synthase n=1 Tax=Allopusillimonas ginsengisoli TaxID=453575 RepID=UPI0010C22888|nr:thiamine phosphate synthase [Allopusillimonas ginsengisoli]